MFLIDNTAFSRRYDSEKEVVCCCDLCHDDIYEDDDIVEFENECYHEECAKEAAFDILIEECGAKRSVAQL